MNKIKYLLVFMVMFLIGNNIILAKDNSIIDFDKKGTLTINLLLNDELPIENAEITIYQVANLISKNNDISFKYQENINTCEANLNDLSNENLANEIDDCIKNFVLPTQTKLTDSNGKVKFENLDLGLYLVKQTNNLKKYSNFDSFLVMIPKIEDNKWNYNESATPKTSIISLTDLSVEKVWNTSSNLESHPDSVTVELYKKDKLIDTVTLNSENNWTYTWKDIEESDLYSVLEVDIKDGYTANYRKENNKFIITNTKTLAKTGNNNLIIPSLTILGLLFIMIGIILEKRKYE